MLTTVYLAFLIRTSVSFVIYVYYPQVMIYLLAIIHCYNNIRTYPTLIDYYTQIDV